MGVQASFECCGNVGWIMEGTKLPPCPTCGKVWIGRETRDKRGVTVIHAEEVNER